MGHSQIQQPLEAELTRPKIFQNYSNQDFSEYLQYLVKDDFYDIHFKQRIQAMMKAAKGNEGVARQ